MLNKILITLMTVGTLTLSAAGLTTYKVSLLDDSTIGGKQFKAGDYKVEIKDGNTAVVKQGKQAVEVPVKTETAPNKFSATEIEYMNDHQVKEIRVGGTNTKLVFADSNTATNGME